ncbi:MAG TPA: kelch repeat-containing protein, partial [Thermoplasmata archaeon]|nr:kelch repeat-containing protein [Thermoplasmata archaeon]
MHSIGGFPRPPTLAIVLTLTAALVISGLALDLQEGARDAPTHPLVLKDSGSMGIPSSETPQTPAGRPAATGPDWYNLSSNFSAPVPGNRTFAALAYDPALNATLMFGGFNHSSFTPYGDTWLFANGSWVNVSGSSTAAPSARWAAMMTWDPWNHEMVLFGGRDTTGTLGDTWVYNASGWTQLSPTNSPSSRQSQFSVFTADPTLRAVYL